MRRVLLFFALTGLACGGRVSSPAQRARDVASWLTASSGVVASWASGSISPAAAESNLESTARTIGDVSRESLPEPTAQAMKDALRLIGEAREAVRAGDKPRAAAKAEQLAALARTVGKL